MKWYNYLQNLYYIFYKNGIKKFLINYGVLNLIYHNILVKILSVKWV